MKILFFFVPIIMYFGFQKHETHIDYTNNDVMKYLHDNTDEGYCVLRELLDNYDDKTKTNGKTHSPLEYLELFFKNATSTLDSVRAAGTLVHEATHRLVRYDYKDGHYYYLNCNKNRSVKHTKTFESRELVEVIPDSCKTLRFKSYINTKGAHITQIHGIYGLLNEFNAYYHGSQSQYDFKPHISENLYLEGTIRSELSAYYEFKYYILTYLIYAEEKYNSQFNDILDNSDFKAIYSYVDTNYGAIIKKFINDGCSISFKEKGDIYCLINVLETPEYQEMNRRISE